MISIKTSVLMALIAHKKNRTFPGLAHKLARRAQENREDALLSKLAEKLDRADASTGNDEEAWK